MGGFLYFLRPGTTKRALFPSLPILGGYQRTALDVLLYAAMQICLLRGLLAPTLTPSHFWPIAALLPIIGILDKTIFLAARAEHYLTTVLCFLFASNWIAGAKAVQLALWFWAGVSKLNHHFPTVIGVMISNSPTMRLQSIRKRMYKSYPNDLRPSSLATLMAHSGAALEFGVPLVLGLASGGTPTHIGIIMMLMLHGFITSCIPMGVPIEWNVMVVYGGFFLCFKNASTSIFDAGIPMLAILAIPLLLLPTLGNLRPKSLSFLLSMRYYAGNWAYSVWLFRGDARKKLENLKKSSSWPLDQLLKIYDRPIAVGLLGKVLAFRAMHLHGRLLQLLLPQTVDNPQNYEWADGEIIAGTTLGWNFGDGHLHNEGLLQAIQSQCHFNEGELRCILVESQPLLKKSLSWQIHDAKKGLLQQGDTPIHTLQSLQPWPEEE